MGLVKEPIGVDFLIESKPLTDKERAEISIFIKASKDRNKIVAIKPAVARRTKKIIT